PVQRGGKVGNGNFNATHLIVQAFRSESVDRAKERRGTRRRRGGLEEIAATRIDRQIQFRSVRIVDLGRKPEKKPDLVEQVHNFYRQVGKQRAKEPQTR